MSAELDRPQNFHRRVNYRLTQWQIAALEKLVRDELVRRADEEMSPWIGGMQSLEETLGGAIAVTVAKTKRRW